MSFDPVIEKHLITKSPPSLYYVPNFITEEEERTLIHHVNTAPKPKWTQLSNRRLQNWGGLPHPKGMVLEDLPKWLQTYTDKISSLGVFEDKQANHVLVNEYKPGQGIMPHEDGPLYYPTVSTLSLGSHTVLDFYKSITDTSSEQDCNDSQPHDTSLEGRHICSVLLERRSLILVRDDMYKVYLHGIAERTEDKMTDAVINLDQCEHVNLDDILTRTTRVSLTIRHVPKTVKAKLLFGPKR